MNKQNSSFAKTNKKVKNNIVKTLTYIWASIAGALTYIGSLVVISELWNGDERSLFVAIVPMLITTFMIVLKVEKNEE